MDETPDERFAAIALATAQRVFDEATDYWPEEGCFHLTDRAAAIILEALKAVTNPHNPHIAPIPPYPLPKG